MSKKEVEKIKEIHREIINDFTSDNRNPRTDRTYSLTTVYFINDKLHTGGCYAGALRTVQPKIRSEENIYILLRFERKLKWFNYNKLFNELNTMFGDYIKVIRFYSGKREARIIGFQVKKKFPDWRLHWIAMYLIFCLIRLVDSRNWKYWKEYFDKNPKKRLINNWKDIIFTHYKRRMNLDKYSINSILKNVCDGILGGTYTDKIFLEYIETYLDVIKKSFGSNYKYTKSDLSLLNKVITGGGTGFYQSKCWQTLESIQGKKK